MEGLVRSPVRPLYSRGRSVLSSENKEAQWVPEPTEHASKKTEIACRCRKSDYCFWVFDPITSQLAKYTIPASLKIQILLSNTQDVLRGICHTSGERPFRYNQTYLLPKLTGYGNNVSRRRGLVAVPRTVPGLHVLAIRCAGPSLNRKLIQAIRRPVKYLEL